MSAKQHICVEYCSSVLNHISDVLAVYQIARYEMEYILKRSGSDSIASKTSGENSDAVVRLRGLPFGCTKEEIANFFLGM